MKEARQEIKKTITNTTCTNATGAGLLKNRLMLTQSAPGLRVNRGNNFSAAYVFDVV